VAARPADDLPAVVRLLRAGGLGDRAARAEAELGRCRACPRACDVDRGSGEVGVCRIGRDAVVANAFPHHGEEDCLRGWRGSGTIFFAGCNLRCVFCQNADVSQTVAGEPLSPSAIADLCLALQDAGCHNVNLVTPEHVAPQLVLALTLAAERGLAVPVVWNTSAYDGLGSLRLLDGMVDVYMPDFKVWEPATARRYLGAADYPEVARAAILEMHRQVGPLVVGPDGLARGGVLVRHLVMPGLGAETAAILRWLAAEVSRDTYVNLMAQYRPAHRVGLPGPGGRRRFSEIDRRPSSVEVDAARAAGRAAGLHRFDGVG